MGLLVQIVRSIQIKKVLSELNPNPRLNFWRIIQGGLLDLPVLDWCKVFGSNAEPTHWKGVVSDVEAFRAALLSHLQISQKEWEKYWLHMKDYRDELVAHYDADTGVTMYPSLELALKSSYFYHDYLLKVLNEGKIESLEMFETLEEYSKRFHDRSMEIAAKAIEATNGIKEIR